MPGPLSGIRIVDLTAVAMGPYATQILGDMGADVIKVESHDGDIFRDAPPARKRGMGAAFLNLNRNKRSIVLDLKVATEHQILLDLLASADVFVSSVRPQSMRKLGLDYATLRTLNPRLIYCGAYGFSEAGPYAGRPAFDDIIQAMSGVAALQGWNSRDGPRYLNTIAADKISGLAATYAIAMALFERERSGQGQAIEVPMFETMVAFTLVEHLAGETFCPAEGPMGYGRVLARARKPFATQDGYLALLPYTTGQWQRFFEIAGRPDLTHDPRVTDAALRIAHADELYAILAGLVSQRTTANWLLLLETADIPHARVNTPQDLLEDPHLRAIGFFDLRAHPSEGEIRGIGIPIHF
ncbi:MAG: CaiB/BaiF CoA transferase family protein, partial [Methylocella sp.]